MSGLMNGLGASMFETTCLKIPKNYGENGLAVVKKMNLQDSEFKVAHDQSYLYVPLKSKPSDTEMKELKRHLPEFEITMQMFLKQVKHQPKLVDLLGETLSPYLVASLPQSIDFVGDIAVVEITPELETHKMVIGEAVLKAHKRVRTVLARSGAVSGVFRLRAFEVIGGEAKTATIHKEHGCVFYVDLAKTYFSPRLSYEHSRVASMVGEGETVVDMFAGVGPFSILTAKKHADVQVYAIDVNPDAFFFLKKNVAVNRVEAKVMPILGDAREIVNKKLIGLADRVIMNLPEKAIDYVDAACQALKPEGGIVHYYEFSNTQQPLETARLRLTEAVERSNRRLEKVLLARIVRGIAPFTYHVVVDAEIK